MAPPRRFELRTNRLQVILNFQKGLDYIIFRQMSESGALGCTHLVSEPSPINWSAAAGCHTTLMWVRFHAILPIFQSQLLEKAANFVTGERSTTELRGKIIPR